FDVSTAAVERRAVRETLLAAPALALAASLAYFLASAVPDIGGTSWHEDEAVAGLISAQPLGDVLHTVLLDRGGAPLHFVLAHIAFAVDGSPTTLRWLSLVFALAPIPVCSDLARRLAGQFAGLTAAPRPCRVGRRFRRRSRGLRRVRGDRRLDAATPVRRPRGPAGRGPRSGARCLRGQALAPASDLRAARLDDVRRGRALTDPRARGGRCRRARHRVARAERGRRSANEPGRRHGRGDVDPRPRPPQRRALSLLAGIPRRAAAGVRRAT